MCWIQTGQGTAESSVAVVGNFVETAAGETVAGSSVEGTAGSSGQGTAGTAADTDCGSQRMRY